MLNKHSLILTLILSVVTSFGLFAQNRTVTSVVRDSNGEPLMGVGVVVDGTTRGTVTDLNGAFSLSVPSGAVVLDISSLGYVSKKVNLTGAVEQVTSRTIRSRGHCRRDSSVSLVSSYSIYSQIIIITFD